MGLIPYGQKDVMEKDELSEEIDGYIEALGVHFNVKNSLIRPKIQDFESIKTKKYPMIFNSWNVSFKELKFLLLDLGYITNYETFSVDGAKANSSYFHYFYGYLNTKMDIGHTYMRPESILDKITEIFYPVEVDFKGHAKFSRRYYVLTRDKVKLESNIKPELLDYLSGVSGLEIEFKDKVCLFKLRKAVNQRDLYKLSAIGLKLDQILNEK